MPLSDLYDPEKFRQNGHRLVDQLADYLHRLRQHSDEEKVMNYRSPEDSYRLMNELLDAPNQPDITSLFEPFLRETIRMHHPTYLGHQTSVVAPLAALSELVGSLLDPGIGVFEQGNLGVVLERILTERLAALAGWPKGASGFLTSGGTLGNLTALLCARQVMAGGDVWKNGNGQQQLAFMASEQSHYSVDRAVRSMGLGENGLIKVPVDQHYRMNPEALEQCLREAQKRGTKVLGVVASSCTTATGSYDPIGPIADFCEANKLWLHVDGAHGACVLFSKKHRHLLAGIERADSFIVDFHKMLLTPKLVTALVFRNGQHSFETFAQKASYLWEQDEKQEWYNLGKRTYELTKSFMSIRVYALWKAYGPAVFEENVDRLYSLAQRFNELLKAQPDFETAVERPESNILCYRLINADWSPEKTNEVNAAIRQRLVEEGKFFIVQTRLGDKLYLRSTVINPMTEAEHLQGLIQEIRSLGSLIA
ncbi:MAG: pyridoxal-dependent decarboxylase [Saprospirales bacterium]|nr:pyridoxal-dependent decarboxylase [Saprospirales bacterium]